jgi:YbgC/YbaW family acyl-CoA thioester hydrolase
MNNAVYLAYLEDWEVQLAANLGWSPARVQAEGLRILARRHQIEYREPALLGDQLELATWLSDVKGSTAVRHYILTRVGDGALLARARALLEWVSLETWQPTPIPALFLEDLSPTIASSESG